MVKIFLSQPNGTSAPRKNFSAALNFDAENGSAKFASRMRAARFYFLIAGASGFTY